MRQVCKKGDVLFSPLVTKLAGKTVQMVNIISGPHHHFKGRNQFTAGCAVPRRPEEPARGTTQHSYTFPLTWSTCRNVQFEITL